MHMQEDIVTKVKIMALSRTRQIQDECTRHPEQFRPDTAEYCDAMYYIISAIAPERFSEIVNTIRDSYMEQGIYDDGYVADSVMMIALAEYQNELGELNIYDMGWTSYVEDFFRTAIA